MCRALQQLTLVCERYEEIADAWPRVLSSIVGISAAVIVGDLIREGTMSYGHALGMLGITTLVTVVIWGGMGLWERST
jgi:ABC-type uncharacterized transport system permease subunit